MGPPSSRPHSRLRRLAPMLAFVAVAAAAGGVVASGGADDGEPSGPAGPALLSRPAVAGEPFTGETATVTPARWRDAVDAVERTWIRCVATDAWSCKPQDIAGATGASYVLGDADVGATVYVAERAHNASGWSEWTTSNAPGDDEQPQGVQALVKPGPPPPRSVPRWTALPAIVGAWRVGETLTAVPGAWTPAADAFAYRWLRCRGGEGGEECEPSPIDGATAATYTLQIADEGVWPQVQVRAHAAGGWSPWAESLLERWDPVGARVAGGPPGSADGGVPGAGSAGRVTVASVKLRPTRVRPAKRGRSFALATRAVKRDGARVTVRLSGTPAALHLSVEQRRRGRWTPRGGWLPVAAPARSSATLRLWFSGRIASRALPRGEYRLRVSALDAAGAASAPRSARFSVR